MSTQSKTLASTGRKDGRPKLGITKNADGLTDGQRRFVEHYVETLNAAESARRSGYAARTAVFTGSFLLRQPHIRAAIEQLVLDRASVTRSMLIEELSAIALADVGDLLTFDQPEQLLTVLEDGTSVVTQRARVQLKPSKELTRRQRITIKSITERTNANGESRVEITQHDKLRAIELLGRALNLFPRDGETNINVGINTAPVASVEVTYADDPAEAHTIDGEATEVRPGLSRGVHDDNR